MREKIDKSRPKNDTRQRALTIQYHKANQAVNTDDDDEPTSGIRCVQIPNDQESDEP